VPEAVIVVPCFNEERRLRDEDFLALAGEPGLHLLFVDDGSKDGTFARLRALRDRVAARIDLLQLERNSGKAEAVRRGLLRALESSPGIVGYVDADLSTPVDEILRLLRELESRRGATVLMGARVRLLGNMIRRHEMRHYLGRIFATAASIMLRVPVYDTQCGAKFFRAGDALQRALGRPFRSRWAFDVELIGRLLTGSPPVPVSEFVEVPLNTWTDVSGSRLSAFQMIGAALDLVAIGAELRRRRHAP